MERILVLIKKCIPRSLFRWLQPYYHCGINFLAAAIYRHPSEALTVIGVTGTTGKTTVTYMIAKMLQENGLRVGYTSTAMFGDGEREWLNDKKMTMVGRFFTQKMLRRMVQNSCDVAIVETTSEGAVQFRHKYINYDIFLFTGLYPEHIDSHGSFENYKAAKLSLFAHMAESDVKKGADGPKVIIVNADDDHAREFLDFSGVKKMTFSQKSHDFSVDEHIPYRYLETNKEGIVFDFLARRTQLHLLGDFTATNAAAAGSAGIALGLSHEDVVRGLQSVRGIPGRLERVEVGQDFDVIVDYAFEPVAVSKLYDTVAYLEPRQIIHVLGSTGGGRDLSRRGELGKIAGERADIVVVTNEDPYDDPPMEIIDDVAQGAHSVGKIKDKDLYLVQDRAEAIQKALGLAEAHDVVLVTGKGSEQAIVVADGKKIPWDDREVVRDFFGH